MFLDDLSELTFCVNYKNKLLPWFVKGFEDEFINANTPLEKVTIIFHAFNFFNKKANKKLKNKKNYIEIRFDNFILNPSIYIDKISKMFGGLKIDNEAYKILCEELEVPRKSEWINKSYWKLDDNFNFEKEFNKMSLDNKKKLNGIIDNY